MPSVCYSKPFYLFYGGELVGQLNMEVRKDIVTFLHNQKEYSFAWSEMQDNISGLSTIIENYATNDDGFEKTMKLYSELPPSNAFGVWGGGFHQIVHQTELGEILATIDRSRYP